MAWRAPPQFAKFVGSDGMEFSVEMRFLEPSERRAIRAAQGLTRFKWNELKSRVGAARMKALKIAGLEVRRATQRSMSVRKELSRPRFYEGGTYNGQRLVIKRYQVPKPDKVTSWKTERHPKGFLRSDIFSDYDMDTQSVVIGPRMAPVLNKLHEIGGKVSLWFTPGVTPRFAPGKFRGAVFGTLANFNTGRAVLNKDRARLEKQTENLQGAFFWGRRRVKPRRYMRQGLDAARGKIPEAFRDFIGGTVGAPVQKRLF